MGVMLSFRLHRAARLRRDHTGEPITSDTSGQAPHTLSISIPWQLLASAPYIGYQSANPGTKEAGKHTY